MINKIKKTGRNYKDYVVYSLFFAACFFFCCDIFFVLCNKSFMWKSDGLGQTYPMFIYTGKWWRTIIKNIFIHHKFSIPMWDMSIGYGADIVSTMNSMWNPFLFLAAIFPAKYSEFAFDLMVVLQLYFSGIAFIAYCRYTKQEFYSSIIGALVYVFSASSFIVFVQSSFGYLFVLFPLIILGIKKIWNKEKVYFYIVFMTLSMAYSYYFTFMTAIFVVAFCFMDIIIGSIENRKNFKKYS